MVLLVLAIISIITGGIFLNDWYFRNHLRLRYNTEISNYLHDKLTKINEIVFPTRKGSLENSQRKDQTDAMNFSTKIYNHSPHTTHRIMTTTARMINPPISRPLQQISPQTTACQSPFKTEYDEKKNYLCCRPSGRFANHLFIYASAYGIASRLNRTLLLSTKYDFPKYFNLKAKIVDDFECVVNGTSLKEEKLCCTFDPQLMEIPKGDNHCVGLYMQSYKYFEHVMDDIRQQYTFRKEYRDKAREIVERAIQTYNSQRNKTSRPTLVAVHVRRGDITKFDFYKTATPEYMRKAMTYFRDKFHDMLFIVCSNDMVWTKEHVRGNDVMYIEGNHFSIDMAVMASCDHTVSSVGTFSWWASFLAGGETVYYEWPVVEKSGFRINFPKNFSDYYLPNWIGMR